MPTIVVNGREHDFEEACTVAGLLARLGLGGRACAVEVNRQVVPKPRHEGHELADGDTVEIVTLVGGG